MGRVDEARALFEPHRRRVGTAESCPPPRALDRPRFDLSRLPRPRERGDDVELDGRARRDTTRPVRDSGGMEQERCPVVGFDLSPAARFVEGTDRAAPSRQWTILAIGSSMMSVAPRSLSAGMSVLISALETTVSTA